MKDVEKYITSVCRSFPDVDFGVNSPRSGPFNGFDIPVPPEMKSLWGVADGQLYEATPILPDGFHLLSVDHALEVWRCMKELYENGEFDGIVFDRGDMVSHEWWLPSWLPFAQDDGGDQICVDMSPGPRGQSGQVIKFWHDSDVRDVLADSVGTYFNMLSEQITVGQITYNTCLDVLDAGS